MASVGAVLVRNRLVDTIVDLRRYAALLDGLPPGPLRERQLAAECRQQAAGLERLAPMILAFEGENRPELTP